MNDLIIELDRVSLRQELVEGLRAEFEAGGLVSGRVSVCDITAAPGMVYFLWHDSGEWRRFQILIRRGEFFDQRKERGRRRGTFCSSGRRG